MNAKNDKKILPSNFFKPHKRFRQNSQKNQQETFSYSLLLIN